MLMPPPTSYSADRVSWPSSISEVFAVVPPMSSVMTFGSPSRRLTSRAPVTPAAGPDSMM